MDLNSQIQRIEELKAFLSSELPIFAEQVLASDLIALVTNRVVQKGINFEGNRFSAYSSKTVAAWRFWGLSRTQAAEKRVRAKARAKGALSYKEFRELNNLNSGKKNFEFTGEMWRKFGIVKVSSSSSSGSVRISIGGTSTAAQNKIDDNSDREGVSIIEASDAERRTVEITSKKWLDTEADRILNA